ncbi:MAG: Gfo/Idh/MocA family protein [Puniceicoccales bacterium]
MPRKIKIGQIGIGHNHASEEMATVRRLSDVFEVVGVVEADPQWREKRGELEAYEGLPWLSEKELFNTPGLEAVMVETDVPMLVPTAMRCLEAGFHVHMDKPAGYSLVEYRTMLDLATRKNLTVQLGYMYRNNPAVQLCQRAVREGWLGQVFELSAVMSRTMDDDYRQWMSQFHGGSMYIFGSHLIDLVISILGKPERVTPFLRQTYPDKDTLVDNAFAVLEYPKTVASVRTSILEVDGFRRRQLVVCGDKGTFEVKPIEGCDVQRQDPPLPALTPRLILEDACGEFSAGINDIVMPPMSGRYDGQLSEFAKIVRGEIENPYPLEHDYTVQEVLLAACGDEPVSF